MRTATGDLWVTVNVGIAFGYYVLGLGLYRLLRRFMRVNTAMVAGAFWFFLTCSATHIEMAYHEWNDPLSRIGDVYLTTHMLVIHTVQVIAVWTFVAGTLYAVATMERRDLLTAQRLREAAPDASPDTASDAASNDPERAGEST